MSEARAALLAAISEARRALADERRIFLEGTYGGLRQVTEAKARILAEMEDGMRRVRPDAEIRAALERVIAESRRNEQIIAAALQGLRSARRRVRAIAEARTGAVAYARDGSRIASAADRAAHSTSA